MILDNNYHISSYSFRGNYSFLELTLCTVTFGNSTYRYAETIQGRKLFKGENYMRKYGYIYRSFFTRQRYLDNFKDNWWEFVYKNSFFIFWKVSFRIYCKMSFQTNFSKSVFPNMMLWVLPNMNWKLFRIET